MLQFLHDLHAKLHAAWIVALTDIALVASVALQLLDQVQVAGVDLTQFVSAKMVASIALVRAVLTVITKIKPVA